MSNSEVGEAESRSIEMRVITRRCRCTPNLKTYLCIRLWAMPRPHICVVLDFLNSFSGPASLR